MIYEPENLKNKRAIYEKRDKWLIRLAFLFWAVLLLIYVNIVIPYVKSTIGFLGIIVGGIAVITIVYFFTVFFVLMRRGRQFRKMNNDIVREYHENKNGELFLEKLLAIDTKPKDMKDEMTWYLNIATYYREQTAQNISHKRLNRSMTRGNVYSIYIDPKHPAVFILAKKIKIGTIVSIILGLFIFTYGIDLLLKFLPMLLSR